MEIRPVSDLRNKFKEIENTLKEDEVVYLTKNGYGTMVVMSVEKYSKLDKKNNSNKKNNKKRIEEEMKRLFGCDDIDSLLEETEKKIKAGKSKSMSVEDAKEEMRRYLHAKKKV